MENDALRIEAQKIELQIPVKKRTGKFRLLLRYCIFILVLTPVSLWYAQIATANWLAYRNFGSEPCWFGPEPHPVNLPELIPAAHGIYIPNPLTQINRRYIGFGVDDMNVHAPHFALATLDENGEVLLWGWSYRQWNFWSLGDTMRRNQGALNDFVADKVVRDYCFSQ